MKFIIITPTYKRPDKLHRCITSVLNQKYQNFEVIVLNDSPLFDYTDFENTYRDNAKIKYFKNEKNEGVNFTRNKALEIAKDLEGDYIIFLDDDDWLYPNALEEINNILEKKSYAWLITNRTYGNTNLSKVRRRKRAYNYFIDMLILRTIYGDVTHIIKKDKATKYNFCTQVKNGEEFYYFIQLPFVFIYKDINSTDSEGYTTGGLTDLLKKRYRENTQKLWGEKKSLKILIYLTLRSLRLLFKK